MTEAQNPPLTDGGLADQIVTAIHHGFALAAADPDTEFPERVEAATVNAVLAAILPEMDRLRAELATARACDCFPNPNDHADRCPIYQAAAPAGEEW